MKFLTTLVLALGLGAQIQAQIKHTATAQEYQAAVRLNKRLNISEKDFDRLLRPTEEYAHYKYLLMTSEDQLGVDKSIFAKNLPADVTLVLLTSPGSENSVRNRFSKLISPDRLIVASHSTASLGFWSRDSFPVPVYEEDHSTKLIIHKYYRNFQGQQVIANSVNYPVTKYDFTFVGGNFMADEFGNCFSVDSDRRFGTTLETIKNAYGCLTITSLPWVSGIGDVDEVLKVLPNKNALTNNEKIKTIMEELGYKVTMLPKAGGDRTYANSVLINGTIFMPSYKTADDTVAQRIYESFGYKVVLIDSRNLSDTGRGSLHCITMAYPTMNLEDLLTSIGFAIN